MPTTEQALVQRVCTARERHERAGKDLLKAVADAFPVGSYVEIPRGRGVVRGVVRHHGSWWATPTRVGLTLTSNGKPFSADVDQLLDAAKREADRG